MWIGTSSGIYIVKNGVSLFMEIAFTMTNEMTFVMITFRRHYIEAPTALQANPFHLEAA